LGKRDEERGKRKRGKAGAKKPFHSIPPAATEAKKKGERKVGTRNLSISISLGKEGRARDD